MKTMKNMKTTKFKMGSMSVVACGAMLGAPAVALADEEMPGAYSYAWGDSRMQSEIGVSVILGGGIAGFTDETLRDSLTTNVAGLWDLRVNIGSHTPIGADISYVGTAANIDALIGTESGTLVGTTLEAAARWNMLPHNDVNPYVFAGIGWQRYDVTRGNFRLSDTGLNESDNATVFPLGAGVAYRDRSGLVVDLRGTFRPTANNDLILESPGSRDFAPAHSWEASAGIGYEF
jgi:opacity protein-like surface antigen